MMRFSFWSGPELSGMILSRMQLEVILRVTQDPMMKK